jgi:hypothetical protein
MLENEQIEFNLTFAHSYEFEYERDFPGNMSDNWYYYPGGESVGGKDGLLVKVRLKEGHVWHGLFSFGHFQQGCPSGIFTTPKDDCLCVVAKGKGYFVSTTNPCSWEGVMANPILNSFAIASKGILVFADFNRLIAYGQSGLKWRTVRLGSDGLNITEVTDHYIKGNFWDSARQRKGMFEVNLDTGNDDWKSA